MSTTPSDDPTAGLPDIVTEEQLAASAAELQAIKSDESKQGSEEAAQAQEAHAALRTAWRQQEIAAGRRSPETTVVTEDDV